jgi:CubicO group peptidase (beta-lactamase class C family)
MPNVAAHHLAWTVAFTCADVASIQRSRASGGDISNRNGDTMVRKNSESHATRVRCRMLLALLVVVVVPTIANAQPTRAQDASEFVRQTKAHLATLATTDGFSGVVLVAKDGKPVFEKAYGFANRADSIRNVEGTRFNIASMGKMFTAVAIMQLVQAGKVSLDDRVGKYLPSYPNQTVRDEVTIHQLLTHTAGLGDFLGKYAKVTKDGYKAVSDYLPLFGNDAPLFKPGSRLAYSNTGFMVLGLVIEAASGETYFDYVRRHIFEPAGMTDTDAYELDDVVPRMAIGYARSPDRPGTWRNNLFANVVKGGPAGGSYSTAADLLKFSNALMHERLLDKASVALLTTGKEKYGSRMYAYGFTEEILNGHRLIGHGGGNVGIADELMIFTDLGYTVVVMTNGEVENFWNIQTFIKKSLAGSSPDIDGFYFTQDVIDATVRSGYDAGIAILQNNPRRLPVRSGLIYQIGNKLIWESKNPQAIDVLRLNLSAFPDLSSGHSDLADAFERIGNKQKAIEAYQKYLTMEPDDADAKEKLRKLEAN